MISSLSKITRCICITICLALLCGTTVTAFAADSDGVRTVRVGYFEFDGYHEQDENGIRSGYGYEMLQRIAGYANLRYEYIGYDKSWGEMQEMLANGEIDLLTSAQKTPEREERYDFSETDIGVSAAILTVKSGESKYLINDYSQWNGIRIGMLTDNSRNDSLAEYAAEQGFTYETVYYDNTELMINELKSDSADKRIDAVLTSNLRHIEGELIIAKFAASPFYAIVRKGDSELIACINGAIKQMDNYEPGWRTRLMNKYYAPHKDDGIAFTAEERAYIDAMQGTEFTALINPDRAPYSMLDDGKLTGVIYEIATEIIKRSGLNITFIDVKDRDTYWNMVAEGTADIRFDVENSYNQAEKDGYWVTNSYITVPVAQLYLKTTSEFTSAAVPLNKDVVETYAQKIENRGLSIVYYDSVAETVEAIESGKQDIAFMAIDTAIVAVRDNVRNRLTAEEIFGDSISYSIAVNQNAYLYSIISKAAASLNTQFIDSIRQNYISSVNRPLSLIGYIYQYPLHVMLAIIILLALVILLIVVIQMSKRRRKEKEYAKKEHEKNLLLKEALDEAERAGMAKGQFLSRVSHEMRTPLNAIIGFIELAKEAESDQLANYLASSDIAAKQLLNVINDVLDMSSIESGKLKIANAPFNFKHLISSITNMYGTQCKQKDLSYETRILSPIDDWLVGDEFRLNQILMNLLGNSVKFTSEGQVSLTISQSFSSEGKLFLHFEVADSGCGMSEEMKERLFRPFEQESASTAKKYGGSGLGLSIVKNLVSMMGGTIGVESVQEKGTTFIVELPFGRSDVKDDAALSGSIEKLKILAVDDEATERDYISQVLSRMNVRYTCVGSGYDALNELGKAEKDNDAYNVCLIDCRMSGMNGFDTTKMIRRKYGKDVVVIIASAYDFEQAGEKAKEAGASMFLSKPVFQSSLFDMLMTLTSGRIAKSEKKIPVYDFSGRRILLAEDNVLNQIVAKGYLKKFNIVVDLAADGQEAVNRFVASEKGYYDAILMDIQMPVMDGFEATKAIRTSKHPEAETIHIIAQTANAFDEDITKSLSTGMNAHITKPIKPELLAEVLQNTFTANDNIS